jgi:hypothetical protein
MFHLRKPAKIAMLCMMLLIMCSKGAISATRMPQPPCGDEVYPAYPDLDHSPSVKVWDRSDLGRSWAPPPCTGWDTLGFSTLVVTAARFKSGSESDDLVQHIGAISRLAGVRYWSTTHQRWQTLIVKAFAMSGPSGERRNDFSTEEMTRGRPVYFEQEDNLTGKAVYRMQLISASPDRIVFRTDNVSRMRYFLVTLFEPGEMQSVYFLDRQPDGVWRYYSIARSGKNASSLTAGHEASSINRAVAYYRHLAGLPTDKEPPAAR